MLLSACCGHQQIVKPLLLAGVDVNVRNIHGFTPLTMAASRGHLEVARVLLEQGADVDAQDHYGVTALIEAARWNYVEIVNLLLEYNADQNIKLGGRTALQWAEYKGHTQVVSILRN